MNYSYYDNKIQRSKERVGQGSVDSQQGLLRKKAGFKQRLQMLDALPQKQRRNILCVKRESLDGNRG